jgi:hypothetical protein
MVLSPNRGRPGCGSQPLFLLSRSIQHVGSTRFWLEVASYHRPFEPRRPPCLLRSKEGETEVVGAIAVADTFNSNDGHGL